MSDYTKQFIKDCLKTESNDFEKIKERLTPEVIKTIKCTLDKFYNITEDMDILKKFIFYGKLPQNRQDFFEELKYESCHSSEEAPNINDKTIRLLHAGLGIATESSEYLDALDSHIFTGHDLDEVNLLEECGDNFWYNSIVFNTLGEESFKNVMDKIIAKLKARYGEKFSDSAAINRNLEAERQILES